MYNQNHSKFWKFLKNSGIHNFLFLHIPQENMPKKLDATDALGIAYCHFLQLGLPQLQKGAKNWTAFAKQKGLVDKQLTGPNARLQAAMQMSKKKK